MTVLDQFDIEPTIALSGSYSDRIFDGNSNLREFASRRPRIVIGIKSTKEIDSSFPFHPSLGYARSDLRAVLNGSAFGSNRFFQATTNVFTEDSVLPTPVDIVLTNGGSPVLNNSWNSTFLLGGIPTTSSFSLLIGVTHTNPPMTSSVPESAGGKRQVSDDTWLYSYPFEQRYRNLPRFSSVKNQTNKSVNCFVSGSPYFQASSLNFIELPATRSIDIHATNGIVNTVQFSDTVWSPFPIGIDIETYAKATFNLLTWYSTGKYLSRLPYNDAKSLSFDPRGFKYGVYSPLPVGLKAIFRRDRFGQIRDMLEQIPTTKMFGKFVRRSGYVDVALEQNFLSGSNSFITASNPTLNTTESGMFDRFARSGKPFDDTL